MPSAVARGSYYQARTKKYLEALGYVVEPLQLYGWIKTPRGLRPIKRDAFGSDLLAVSTTQTLYVQVKGGETWRTGLAAARAAFARYPLGPSSQQVIIGWSRQAREPEVIVVATGPCQAQHPVIVPPRRKAKTLPLFARPA
jgi:hypothetical protein